MILTYFNVWELPARIRDAARRDKRIGAAAARRIKPSIPVQGCRRS